MTPQKESKLIKESLHLVNAGKPRYPGDMAVHLRLYSRPGCHLCEEMKAVIGTVTEGYEVAIEEVDISRDPALEAEFGSEIPVLFVNDRKAFKYRLTAAALRRRLQREAAGGRWSWARLRGLVR
jgi:hypothetical protein